MSLAERARRLIGDFEGTVPHMYLDTTGHVTVGIGCLLATPQVAIALVWQWRSGAGGEPGPVEISDEWLRVHGAVAGMRADAYRPLTRMELLPSEVDRLFRRRLDQTIEVLAQAYPLWPEWPLEAQLAALDMAFNLGPYAVPRKWPRLSAALRAMDWRAAAEHSHRPQSRDRRNEAVRELFEEAAVAGVVPAREIT